MGKKDEIKSGVAKSVQAAEKSAARRKQLLLCVGIILGGIVIGFVLVKLQKPPRRVEIERLAPLVKVEQLNVKDVQMVIRGFGTVSPKVEVEIVPQVSGKVVWVNAQFRAGGFIGGDEQILKIDPRDYELSVRQAEAIVADGQVALDLEKAEAQVARSEWDDLNPNMEPASSLVLREPQIRQAQARLESAKAQLARAELNLARTRLSLPIDARIINENVDLGQYVISGQSLGAAYGIEAVEIELPLEDEELAWFRIPGNPIPFNSSRQASEKTTAQVKANFAGAEHTWTGYVMRTTGQVDRRSRLVSVVVEVSEPFAGSDSRPALVPGMFVEVIIEGEVLQGAVAVPRDAIREGNKVWLVKDGRLQIRRLEIVRADRDFAYTV